MNALLIKNGRLLDPASGRDETTSILLQDGRVACFGAEADSQAGDADVIDAKGLLVAPGFIDIHTHLREPGREDKETIYTGTRAAAAGGYTTVCPIPNTDPVIDTQTGLKFVLSRAESDAVVNVMPFAAVTRGQKGEEIVEFGDLVYYGARGFTDDGHPIMNSEIMRRALEYSAMFDVPILDHCEDAALADGGSMHEGHVSTKLGLKGIPAVAESLQVARDVELAAFTGGHIHIMHVSKEVSLHHVRAGKARGVKVTCEVTPHHLTLTDDELADFNTCAKVNPCLGASDDREALIEALLNGTIDCIATDHAPHTDIEKDQPITDAPFGMIGLETAFAVLYTELVLPGRVPLELIIEKMTSAPAKVLHFEPRGTLAPGAPADVVLIDLDRKWEVTRDGFLSKSKNSPYVGRQLQGGIEATIVGGRVVYRDGRIVV
ncbi:dihydroorotase [candidate division BRC1 bacterium HGW-BRC1-1]|nr:MAG: dihydroorotase [candidate division BRC1 bacterium HGW-BRC1-1]